MKSGGSRPPVEIKICGITNLPDALESLKSGADALGFNFFPGSKRYVEFETARSWITQLPAGIQKVAVVVKPTWEDAMKLARSGIFDFLQLHGGESPEFCRKLADQGIGFVKVLPMNDESSLAQPSAFSTNRVLLDSATVEGFGGTGRTFPWSLARRFIDAHPELQVGLAGGLTAENVAEAIAAVRPNGIDVTTGVEAAVGRKDPARLRAFISATRAA
ncbi:MAG TPA: phosphoribosylanthranilate isomerase [Chthoniobacterales bacterium]